MALPPAFLEELRARTPLAAVIGRRVRLARSGRQWKGCCPFHGEKTPSFYVYDDHFHCFGCGAHGDAIAFVMQSQGLPFPEAVESLAAEAGLEVPKPAPAAAEAASRQKTLHDVLAAAAAAFQRRLHLPEGRPALDYLRRRGLTDQTIARFGLGWSGPGRGALAADLKREGIEPGLLVEAGLCRAREDGEGVSDFFFDRVMFPIRDRRGRAISFGGRVLGDGQPKYLNGPESPVFSKRRTLYGHDLARNTKSRPVVVEGYMDVIALHQAGIAGAVAPLGTALTAEHLEALWGLSAETPVLCFDGDTAGLRAADRSLEVALPLLGPDRSLRVLELPASEDPDTLVAREGAAGFSRRLDTARDLTDILFQAARRRTGDADPHQRAALLREMDRMASLVGDRTLAGTMRAALRDRFYGQRRQGAPRLRSPVRPGLHSATARRAQAALLTLLVLDHPAIWPEVEEHFSAVPLDAACSRLRTAIGAWVGSASLLDSEALLAHVQQSGLGSDVVELRRLVGRRTGLTDGDTPEGALQAWWHFHGMLTRDRLDADIQAARSAGDLALVTRLTEERLLLLAGETT